MHLDNRDASHLGDLPDALTEVATRPTPDAARGLKVAQRLQALDRNALVALARQRDEPAGFSVEVLLDCCPRAGGPMTLAAALGVSLAVLLQDRMERAGAPPVARGDADVHPDVRPERITVADRLGLRILDEHAHHQAAALALAQLAVPPEDRTAPECG
jgi:hypothetical protein